MNGDGAHVTVPEAWLGPAERHAAARDAYRRSVDDGAPLSAAALAAQFDRSPRWAQDRIAEVRRQRSTIQPLSSNGTDHAAHGHRQRPLRAAASSFPTTLRTLLDLPPEVKP